MLCSQGLFQSPGDSLLVLDQTAIYVFVFFLLYKASASTRPMSSGADSGNGLARA
jgi:hypothetical protein